MEHLNELYGATQEETNELRKKTEELIDTMESLNDSNQEGASSLRTLKADIKSAKQGVAHPMVFRSRFYLPKRYKGEPYER